ncbi:MAG: hypothetical protein GEV06_28880, partial [Luteitalea sp.]|nr:hypothetical protein [Luteitalea sp.]
MTDEEREKTAWHEAGHAVMRWLENLPATELTLHETGGLCAGTGRMVSADKTLNVGLAGYAVEATYLLFGTTIDIAASRTSDFDEARECLKSRPHLCWVAVGEKIRIASVDEALEWRFKFVCERLGRYSGLVDL